MLGEHKTQAEYSPLSWIPLFFAILGQPPRPLIIFM